MPPTPRDPKENPQRFSELFSILGYGDADTRVTESLRKLVEKILAVSEEGGSAKGQLVITLKVAADKKGRVGIATSCKVTQPELPIAGSALFASPDGRLQVSDPRQEKLPLRAVGGTPTPIRGARVHVDEDGVVLDDQKPDDPSKN